MAYSQLNGFAVLRYELSGAGHSLLFPCSALADPGGGYRALLMCA